MKVKLNNSAPSAYWEHARKIGIYNSIVDVSDNNGEFLLKNDYGILIKDLGKTRGRFAHLKFGDKVTWKKKKALFFRYNTIDEFKCYVIQKLEHASQPFCREVKTNQLERGWKK
jgi:uncharacterized Zn ribbon protein